MTSSDWVDMQRQLAAIDRQLAELHVRRATIQDAIADGKADPKTGRRKQRPHVPTFATVSPTDQARAAKALRDLEKRRKDR